MAILNNSNAISSGGYGITNSLRFRASASAYLNRTTGTATSATTWTWSAWVKRGSLSSVQALLGAGSGAGTNSMIYFDSDNSLGVQFNGGSAGAAQTTAVYRDTSAWYHIVVKVAATTATVYVNGTQMATASVTPTYINANSTVHYLGIQATSSRYFDGYMAEVNFIDGQALTPSSFGSTNSTTGVWQPAKYTGTYGTNGFYLNFNSIALTSGSNTGLGKDNSGNGNYWNTNNISVTAGTTYDAMIDSPTLTSATVANYCVLNVTAPYGSSLTLSQANLRTTCAGAYWASLPGTFLIPTTGKWYWEVTPVVATNMPYDSNISIGISKNISTQYNTGQDQWPGFTADSYGVTNDVSSMYKWTNVTPVAYGASYTISDIIGVGLDMDAGTLTYYKNGVSQGVAFSGLTGNFVPSLGVNNTGTSAAINFGQRPFSYTPPSGYVALNTYNLPTPTILQGNKYMDATLYTGNGSGQTVVNAGQFKPDFTWVKARSTTYSNTLVNSVMGLGSALFSDTTGAVTSTTEYTSYNSNGFTLGASGSTASNVNAATYVAWQWQAGQGSSSSNTNGSITSTVSVNATAGFSVVTYTGTGANATVGHGLGVAPKMVIVKSRSYAGTQWVVWHTSLTSGAYTVYLNLTNAQVSAPTVWNSTTPTSSVFSVGTNADSNNNGSTYVAYCWAAISGYSAFGNYTGNGSTDGSFVYTGFLPRFVMIKRTDTTGDWYMWDTARNTFDVITNTLLANSSAAETSATSIDALSNGFKLRNTTAGFNASGGTYIYAAFASNPFKYSNSF